MEIIRSIMFDDPVLVVVNSILLLGILLAMVGLPALKKETRKLHEKNLALRTSHNDEGY